MVSKTFKKGIMLAILVVIAIAFFDIIAAKSGVFGTLQDYTLGNYTDGWWDLFYKFNLILLMIVPLSYYFFARRDVSESVALFFTSFTLWFTGLADALYFILQGKAIPATLPWLNCHIIMSKVASVMGQEVVTKSVLFASIALGFVAVYFITKYMEKI